MLAGEVGMWVAGNQPWSGAGMGYVTDEHAPSKADDAFALRPPTVCSSGLLGLRRLGTVRQGNGRHIAQPGPCAPARVHPP